MKRYYYDDNGSFFNVFDRKWSAIESIATCKKRDDAELITLALNGVEEFASYKRLAEDR